MFKSKIPWVSGALPIQPDGISGITPLADPEMVFTHLKQLAPQISRIHVVFSERSQWEVELAQNIATRFSLTILPHRVDDPKTAIVTYTELLKIADPDKEAFWLPLDSITANDKYVLPLILEAAWDKRLVVFSSKPQHAKRGALFSLYPDNELTGVNLVRMVEDMYKLSTKASVIPTMEVKLAVNLRTASHLGLEYTTKQKGLFHLTFPSR